MNRQKFLLTILIIVLAVTAYFLYYSQNQPGAQDTEISAYQEFELRVAELEQLKKIQLDTSIFEDQFFRNLTVPKEVLPSDKEKGRKNPFVKF